MSKEAWETLIYGIVAFVVVLVICLGITAIGGITKYIDVNVNRTIFKESLPYTENMAQDLAKYRLEYSRETDKAAKEAIKDTVRNRYANFDINKLDDGNLRQFLRECRQ